MTRSKSERDAGLNWPLLLLAARETLAADDAVTRALETGDSPYAAEICVLMMLTRPDQWKRLMLAYMAFHHAAEELLRKPAGSA
jgi:hypothetical protein